MQQRAEAEIPNDQPAHEPVLADLLSRLFRDAEELLLQELALARAEIGENLGWFVGGGFLVAAGIATAFVGALALIAGGILLLGDVMPPWAACALVGGLIFAAGTALALYGRHIMARGALLPRRTLRTLRETGDWARQEAP